VTEGHCPICGAEIKAGDDFCGGCGANLYAAARLTDVPLPPSMKKRKRESPELPKLVWAIGVVLMVIIFFNPFADWALVSNTMSVLILASCFWVGLFLALIGIFKERLISWLGAIVMTGITILIAVLAGIAFLVSIIVAI